MKLVEIAQRFDTPLYLVRAVCLLQRKSPLLVPTGSAGIICTIYYQESFTFNGSRKPGDATNPKSQFSGRESQLLRITFSSVVKSPVSGLITVFLNHRTRSECPERVGKSPTQLMTGQLTGWSFWVSSGFNAPNSCSQNSSESGSQC